MMTRAFVRALAKFMICVLAGVGLALIAVTLLILFLCGVL